MVCVKMVNSLVRDLRNVIIHSKYFFVFDWLKSLHNSSQPAIVDPVWKTFG